jgi:ABC-type amino acid transport substrate-binding protein
MRQLLFFLLLLPLFAQSETLKIGIKPSEPWVMYDQNASEENRKPIGFSIDLWNKMASDMNTETQWVYYESTSALVEATKNG